MPRLILKSPYLKPGRKKSPGGYLKYIATREGVEMAEDTSRHLPATVQQKKQIDKLLKNILTARTVMNTGTTRRIQPVAMQICSSAAFWNYTVTFPAVIFT